MIIIFCMATLFYKNMLEKCLLIITLCVDSSSVFVIRLFVVPATTLNSSVCWSSLTNQTHVEVVTQFSH